ncbi:hypothetical protein BSKO_10393 [Bryopsis sp. KO-2023]|nr:hypothetical protein BSKO_10393 [Bryopsis sp. KO-2023]
MYRDANRHSPQFRILKPTDVQPEHDTMVTRYRNPDRAVLCPAMEEFLIESFDKEIPEDPQEDLSELFALSWGNLHLDHSSYGGSFKLARKVQVWFQAMIEDSPAEFFEAMFAAAVRASSSSLALLLGGCKGDFVPVPSAPSGVHAVLTSCQFGSGDRLMISSVASPAARNVVMRWSARCGAGVIEVLLGMDVLKSTKAILEAFETALAGSSGIKLLILDHVCSFPSIAMPIKEIAALCRRYGCKWFCAPKGAAFLWVRRQEQDNVEPVVGSHGSGLNFQERFFWADNGDMSAWMSIPAVAAVLETFSASKITARNIRVLQMAVARLACSWDDVEVLGPEEDGIPVAAAQFIASEGKLWMQISAHLYNSIQEFERLVHAVPKLLDQMASCATYRPPPAGVQAPPPGFDTPCYKPTPPYKPPRMEPINAPTPVPYTVPVQLPPMEPDDPCSSTVVRTCGFRDTIAARNGDDWDLP